MAYSQTLSRSEVAPLLIPDGYKLIKGYVEDLDIGHVTASMVIRSGKRLVSLLLPVADAKISGAEVGRPIYCLMNGKDVFVFRDINYMMRKILNK